MSLKVRMVPHELNMSGHGPSGIKTLTSKYFKYLPKYDIEMAGPHDDEFDVLAVHAGMTNQIPLDAPTVSHIHGLYWTADYPAYNWQHKANQSVINSLRIANTITVPSEWVAQNVRRDMRVDPDIVGHGIDFEEWQHDEENLGYVLWNKNRDSDVCSPRPVSELAHKFPQVRFLTTFADQHATPNVKKTGLVPHETMREMVKQAGIYLSSTKETFGIGTLEAMAAGVPILGFNHGGTAFLVDHGVTGYLARPGDMDDLARGLIYCQRHRRTLGLNAREVAKQYTWDRIAEQLANIYRFAHRKYHSDRGVTVVIPCYNKGGTLWRAVRSALSQTVKPVEIIIVDNNSTDDSMALASQMARENEIVSVINCERQGVAHARNLGIRNATTQYICCLDADDEIEPSFLEVCSKALDNDLTVGLAYTKLLAISPEGHQTVSAWPDEYDYAEFIRGKNQVPTCCVFRHELWKRAGGYKQRYAPHGAGAEDAELWFHMGSLGYKGVLASNQPLFRYHLGGGVSGDPNYREVNWRAWHPWVEDGQHPFASIAPPKNGLSHSVRQYDEPTVSIVVPCSDNHVDHVTDLLDSLDAQTYRKWEAIVVFDGQRDPYLESYPHVRTFKTSASSKGPGAARNLGAKHAKAPLLLFMDADDWLVPEALEIMVSAYHASPNSVIYSDYYAHSIIDHTEMRKLQTLGRLKHYDGVTKEAIVYHKAFEYDCHRAQQQPNPGDMYIWNLIASLHPKKFFDAVGGFDESMKSWEDWDYWLRMSHKGYCFIRVDKPLMEYRFYTGTRRSEANPHESGESGRQLGQELIQYLLDKYEGVEKMGCGGCKKHRTMPVAQPPVPMASTLNAGVVNSMTSEEFVWVILQDGNIGMHPISVKGVSYGYRRDGDKFKMQRGHAFIDQRVRIVEPEAPPEVEQEIAPEPEAPPEYSEWAKEDGEPEVQGDPLLPLEEDIEKDIAVILPPKKREVRPIVEDDLEVKIPEEYDLKEIWGITEERENTLLQMGIRSPQGLVILGERRIMDELGVTETVAKRMIKSAATIAVT